MCEKKLSPPPILFYKKYWREDGFVEEPIKQPPFLKLVVKPPQGFIQIFI